MQRLDMLSFMERYILSAIKEDIKKKMIFVTGPRQVGKTHFSKQLITPYKKKQYLNYDNSNDAVIINKENWNINSDIIVFDEIHKKKNWKKYLKGVYDTKKETLQILATGSSRMDTFRQSGESLAGRYFHYKLNPLSVKELKNKLDPYSAIEKLNKFGGFPEPFLSDSERHLMKWQKQYYVDLIREDILEFSRISELNSMKLLLGLLRKCVGSPLSYRGLAQDMQIAPNTVRKYISILESLHIIFLIKPFHRNIARALSREPKCYFYDSGYVIGNDGLKLENTCAVCLLKHVEFMQDYEGINISLNYIRTKEKHEVDFALIKNENIEKIIEVKLSDSKASSSLIHFKRKLPNTEAIQLVHNLKQEQTVSGISIERAGEWLAELSA